MQIAEVVALPPACCAVCKKGNAVEKPFVDTLSHYPQGQRMDRIYVCAECVEEMAGLYGMVSKEQAQKFQDEVDALKDQVADLEARNQAFNSIQSALDVFNPPAEPETVVEAPKKAPAKAKAKPVAEEAPAEQ